MDVKYKGKSNWSLGTREMNDYSLISGSLCAHAMEPCFEKHLYSVVMETGQQEYRR